MSSTGVPQDSSPEYRDAVAYLYGRINYERLSAQSFTHSDFKLQRMRRLLDLVGSPEATIPVIHVAGTKGKGSTSTMSAAMLQAAGYRVGLYTSPHLNRFEERFLVDGECATEAEVVELVDAVRQAELAMGDEGERLTFFELTTAMAWLHFQRRQVRIAVLEVGLGGRLDSTNLCHPLTTIISSISRDHMKLLGETLASIAREKAGIAKRGVQMLSGVTPPDAVEAIREACLKAEAPLWEIGREIEVRHVRLLANVETVLPHYEFDLSGPNGSLENLAVPLAGRHQVENAALAVTAVTGLQSHGFSVDADAVHRGLRNARLPLRLEILRRAPLVIVDAAHNDASMEAVRETIRGLPASRKTLVFASSKDKETARILEIAAPAFDRILVTQYLSNPRAVPPDELLALARQFSSRETILAASPLEAWQRIQVDAQPQDLVCVTGSFFLAAEFRDLLVSPTDPTGTPCER